MHHPHNLDLDHTGPLDFWLGLGMTSPDEKPMPSEDKAKPPPSERDLGAMLEDYAKDLRAIVDQLRRKLH